MWISKRGCRYGGALVRCVICGGGEGFIENRGPTDQIAAALPLSPSVTSSTTNVMLDAMLASSSL